MVDLSNWKDYQIIRDNNSKTDQIIYWKRNTRLFSCFRKKEGRQVELKMDFCNKLQNKNVKCFVISTFRSYEHIIDRKQEFDQMSITLDVHGMELLFLVYKLNIWDRLDLKKDERGNQRIIKEKLEEFFNIESSTGSIIYYTGHGNQDGDMLLSNIDGKALNAINDPEILTFETLQLIWGNSSDSLNKNLLLIMDSCYANKWIDKARSKNTKNISIITAQKKGKDDDQYSTILSPKIGSHFTSYFLSVFNPTDTNDIRLQRCIDHKNRAKKCQDKQLFCEHNNLKPYSYIPQPNIMFEVFNFKIEKELKEWSDYDLIRNQILFGYDDKNKFDNFNLDLKVIFPEDARDQPNSRIAIQNDQIFEFFDDNCINVFQKHFTRITLRLDLENVTQVQYYIQKYREQRNKITFKVDSHYTQDEWELLAIIVYHILQMDYISLDLSFTQIFDIEGRDLILKQLFQQNRGGDNKLKMLALSLSYNNLSEDFLIYFLEIFNCSTLKFLEHLVIDLAWNQFQASKKLEQFKVIDNLESLKTLCLSFSQNKIKDNTGMTIIKSFAKLNQLEILHLHFQYCGIGDLTANEVFKLVKNNQKLNDFYFNARDNFITEDGMKPFKSIDNSNFARFYLLVSGNPGYHGNHENQGNQEQQEHLFQSIRNMQSQNTDLNIQQLMNSNPKPQYQ